LLLLGILCLPPAFGSRWAPSGDLFTMPLLFGGLAVSIGLPVLALSASAPVLPRWYTDSGARWARGPDFLCAARHAGRLAVVLAFRVTIEPNWTLHEQVRFWTVGYIVLLALTAVCGCAVAFARSRDAAPVPEQTGQPVTAGRRLLWVALAFV